VALAAGLPFFLLNRQTRVAPEARKHYELGQEFAKRRTRENLANAIKEYESALKIEAKFGDAWSGLADAYSAMANYNFMQPSAGLNKAREAATRAVRLNPDSGRANGVMAYIISIDVRRWLEAGPHFERAVHLDPLESVVRLWYGAWLGKRGQFNAALSQLNIGLERDPASFNLHHQRAIEYFRAKHFTEFLIEAREVVRLQPYEASSHLSLARALEWTGRLEEARASCGDAEKYGNGPAAMCGRACVEARGGNLQLAKRMEEEVYEYWNANPFETLSLAQLCSLLEGPKEVFAILGAGYERGDSTVLGSPASPYFDKWHQEPGFRELNRKLGLPA
jgi:Tfp pilus assembly protein PilF